MALRDPAVVYTAADNDEAHHVCNLLNLAGVEAYVTEDDPILATAPQIHKPRVWVERAEMDRAQPVLLEHEGGRAEAGGAPVAVTCEECGKGSTFPAKERGSVQSCPHCGAYVDVGDEADMALEGEPDDGIVRAEDREGVINPDDGADDAEPNEGIVRAEDREGVIEPDREA